MHLITNSLSRKLLAGTAGALAVASIGFLLLFAHLYRSQLELSSAQASQSTSQLLRVALENAMLKRDLDGLRDIVINLGAQPGIKTVAINDPTGEVRFASHRELLGQHRAASVDGACAGCLSISSEDPVSVFTTDGDGDAVLRTIHPVRNRPVCSGCHGAVASNPINGLLVVDHDASAIRSAARVSSIAMLGSGAFVTLLTVGVAWWLTRRLVLRPVAMLAEASEALTLEQLDRRVPIRGNDELATLGRSFNSMADRLESSLGALRDKEAFAQGLIDAIPDGVRVIDDDYAIVASNAAYRRQLGLPDEPVRGVKCYQSSHARDEPCPIALTTCPLHEVRRSGKPVRVLQQHTKSNGQPLSVEVIAAPLVTSPTSGAGTMIVEAIRDIDKEVQFSHEQKLAEMGRIAAGVAHEIHNPLASIRVAVQAALRAISAGRDAPVSIRSYLEVVDSEIDACISSTKRLLKLGSPSSERPGIMNVNDAVHDTITLLTQEADERGVRLVEELAADELTLTGHDGELRMLVFNLAQNALHAMPRGGMLRISTLARGGVTSIDFEDNGTGISPDDLPHIFEPFFSKRADGVRGTGLGLPICKAIASRHGGGIEVLSHVPGRTCFRVTVSGIGNPERSIS